MMLEARRFCPASRFSFTTANSKLIHVTLSVYLLAQIVHFISSNYPQVQWFIKVLDVINTQPPFLRLNQEGEDQKSILSADFHVI